MFRHNHFCFVTTVLLATHLAKKLQRSREPSMARENFQTTKYTAHPKWENISQAAAGSEKNLEPCDKNPTIAGKFRHLDPIGARCWETYSKSPARGSRSQGLVRAIYKDKSNPEESGA